MKPKYLIALLSVIVAALLGFLAASCGAGEGAESAGPVPSEPAELGTTSGTATATTVEEGSATETVPPPDSNALLLQVWLTKGESLFVVTRRQAYTRRVGTAAVEALLEGPEAFEAEVGVQSAIPAGTQFLGLQIEDGIAFVDLTSEFESGGGSFSMTMRLAQVVCTLDQFPTVKGVLFKLDGEPVDVFSGEGIVLDHPVGCKDYEDVMPVILVTSPTLGQRVSSPVPVRGSANVFEANVTIRILDEDGDEIANTFTTATCGSGCRGHFLALVNYEVDHEQPGTIVVQDDDAAGTGTPPHQVRIPVILTPGP